MTVNLRGLGAPTPEQQSAYDKISCPAGFSKWTAAAIDPSVPPASLRADEACVDGNGFNLGFANSPEGQRQIANRQGDSSSSKMMFVAAASALIILPGWAKLLAIPVAFFGMQTACKHGQCGM